MLDLPSRTSLRSLTDAANAIAPAVTLGFSRAVDAGLVSVLYAYPHGIGEFVVPYAELPEVLSPVGTGPASTGADLLRANPRGVLEWFLLYGDVQRIESWPLREVSSRFWVGWLHGTELTPEQELPVARLMAAGTAALGAPLGSEEAAGRLRRLRLAAELLPALLRVLDVRDVFDRLSGIARRALPHDVLILRLIDRDLTKVVTFARSGGGTDLDLELPQAYPPSVVRAWTFDIIDDLTIQPLEMDRLPASLGIRSCLRLPLKFDDRVVGGLIFLSKTPGVFTSDDAVVGRHLADHVAIALSHHDLAQQLAEQARHTEALRARTVNLELLDELLAALIDAGDLPDVFGRISSIAQKVLSHDALVLMVRLPDGRHARVYASSGVPAGHPEVMEVPDELLRNPDWEHDIFDDLSVMPDPRSVRLSSLGFRSLLRVPIRLDGRFAGALVFLANARDVFRPADILVARRIADRMAVTLARDRVIEASKRADEAAARASQLEARVRALTDELDARTGYRRVIGESAEWRQVLTQATQVASTETTVLLLGESGTGKEVVSRFIHRGSSRNNGPFVALNCAALPEQLLEAELFGYERGAYTGATQSKPGQLEQAAGGTLFLDEVAEMSPSAQAKLLRVLQEREFQRLGGTRILRTDARVVAATNRDLERGIANGQFREDLYYRLNVFAIRLPPLRERRADVLPLAEAFLVEVGRGLGRPPAGIARDARDRLVEYHWPGNVRELRNILERAAILCDGGLITAEHLALTVPAVTPARPLQALASRVDEGVAAAPRAVMGPSAAADLPTMERAMIEQALQVARFNKSKAAKALGLTRHQLYVRMRKHGLET